MDDPQLPDDEDGTDRGAPETSVGAGCTVGRGACECACEMLGEDYDILVSTTSRARPPPLPPPPLKSAADL